MTDVPNEKNDYLRRINTLLLYQPFVERLNAMLNGANRRGWIYIGTNGRRNWEEQDALYALGRTKPGGIVTNARGGYSLHNFAIAGDFCRHKGTSYDGKLIPDYLDASYQILAEEAERVGLESGYRWDLQGSGLRKDAQHVQLPVKKHGITLATLRDQYGRGGYPSVFAFLDRYAW